VDHILNSNSARIASDIKKVDENLRKERSKKDKYSDHPYQRGRCAGERPQIEICHLR